MSFAGVTTAFAAGPGLDANGALNAVDQDHPAQAGITKILQMPIGTNVPEADFKFTVTKESVDGDTGAASTAPDLNSTNLIVSYPGGTSATSGDVTTVTQETGDIFENVTFPHAGVYVYTIKEAGLGTNTDIEENSAHESLTYSDAVYTMTVWVSNMDPGPGTYIAAIGTVVTVADNGDQTQGTKIDPTPGGDGDTYLQSQMVFTNTYIKTNGPDDPTDPDPTDPGDATLSVSKTVDGALANLDQYFNFKMTISPVSLLDSAPASYKAYVVEGSDVVTSSANGTVAGTDAGGAYILISTSATGSTFNLKTGQKLVFVDTPVGTGYDVSELTPTGYVPSYAVTTNAAPVASDEGPMSQTIDAGAQRVGELANKADFTNTRDWIAPTGLTMNQLPFVGLIVLAVGALVAFVVVKTRKGRASAARA